MPGTCPNVHGAPARDESIADFSISRRRAAATALAAAALPLAPGRTCAQTERAPGERAPGGGPARKTLLGVYVAHDLLALREFEGIIGRRVDGVLEYTHSREWSDMGPSRHLSNVLGQSGRGIFWSMPHYAAWESRDNGLADMRAVAAGARDADFVRWAARTPCPRQAGGGRELLPPRRLGDAGEWFPWSLSASRTPPPSAPRSAATRARSAASRTSSRSSGTSTPTAAPWSSSTRATTASTSSARTSTGPWTSREGNRGQRSTPSQRLQPRPRLDGGVRGGPRQAHGDFRIRRRRFEPAAPRSGSNSSPTG